MFLSFPEGTEMFQFPSFALTQRQCRAFNPTGCPIRISPDLYLFAVPRSFSQLTTSFFASESLGIHLTLFLPSSLFGYFPNSSEKLLAFEIVLFTFRPLPFCAVLLRWLLPFRFSAVLTKRFFLPRYLFPILQ